MPKEGPALKISLVIYWPKTPEPLIPAYIPNWVDDSFAKRPDSRIMIIKKTSQRNLRRPLNKLPKSNKTVLQS